MTCIYMQGSIYMCTKCRSEQNRNFKWPKLMNIYMYLISNIKLQSQRPNNPQSLVILYVTHISSIHICETRETSAGC
jgi:hypothetical protein